ncbi:hypothetical protein KZ483_15825 [Paenibacillus sp. sptzw28]|uniref:hypothetical protein n=1 Tax=Paenibacillus sp. sptzw28 TaxID=715179 RepID=UPI001C6F3B24|nr:hypothetical protein [Paenibacillus sp. sptzw28]QYR19397.1 hypothetical protein KZ483_15825 [Paenibacillus sp. sptzw28]
MSQSIMDQLTEEQRYLVYHSMQDMDLHFDDEMKMIRHNPNRHSTRGSAHYALGLLTRNAPGDLRRACDVLGKVLEMQLDYPEEIYHGTFRTAPQQPHPPAGNLPWKTFAPGFAYYLDATFEKISARFIDMLAIEATPMPGSMDLNDIKNSLQKAIDDVLPPVWKSYDPNWREFIACTFAVILENFEEMLPDELVVRMDGSMVRAVSGSIDRRLSDAVPMNTNIELMHIFVSHYFGHRYNDESWIAHAAKEAESLLTGFNEFRSFAEFNTTTYYGVDLTVLGLWRKYGKSAAFQEIGHEVEKGLWENIALFYNANLENLSGPFSRAYEMEMRAHSSIGVFLYLALGKGYEYLAAINCESGHDPMIALVGVDVPEQVMPALIAHQGERLVEKKFRELCERDKPGSNSNLCTAAAWIGESIMIGAMSGSRNTNGQMYPATIHWKTEDGKKYYMRLIRREKGGHWNTHLRGITYEAKTNKNQLTVEVQFETNLEIELYFEIRGTGINAEAITPNLWIFPGLACRVEAEAPAPSVIQYDDCIKIIYPYRPDASSSRMSFTLNLE